MDGANVEMSGGFSMVKIVLSDALPAEAFHPDFEQYLRDKRAGLPVPDHWMRNEEKP